jgi:hypothetical protein
MKSTTKTICALDQLIVPGSRSATKSVAVLIGLLILCSLPPACTSRSKPNQSPLDAEARQKGEEYWYSALTKCGASYYGKYEPNDFTYQFNDVSIELTHSQLTEASRLNGIEWSGWATLQSKTSRMRVKKMEWDSWRNGSSFPLPAVPIKRVNGRWLIDDEDRPSPRVKRIDCSEVK